jgi:hypothetical protein
VTGSLDNKKAEEDAIFCLIKDGTFFHFFFDQRSRHWLDRVKKLHKKCVKNASDLYVLTGVDLFL